MHPEFLCLYQAAADRGFVTGILGNPAGEDDIDNITAIQTLSFFQVSLEGLEPHNDYIRGKGHFRRVISFLELLAKKNIYTKVMLTLTRTNQDQVIPLGRYLQGKADQFVFNRLSLQGEGAALEMADPKTYADFLRIYIKAAGGYPVMGFKDNLFNGIFQEMGKPLFGGCTGFGCGAAFNFVSVLPTGEVHACRKFDSPLGNLTRDSLTDIYHSSAARQYRTGPQACLSCDLNRVCRGCLAASQSTGLDIFVDRDPYCFKTALF
jgi:selenobiotic family peptide radical SAM maturase